LRDPPPPRDLARPRDIRPGSLPPRTLLRPLPVRLVPVPGRPPPVHRPGVRHDGGDPRPCHARPVVSLPTRSRVSSRPHAHALPPPPRRTPDDDPSGLIGDGSSFTHDEGDATRTPPPGLRSGIPGAKRAWPDLGPVRETPG